MKLAAKMTLCFLLPVMLITALTSYLTVQSEYRQFEEKREQVAQEVSEQLRDSVIRAIRQEGLPGAIRLLKNDERARLVFFDDLSDDSTRPAAPRRSPGNGTVNTTYSIWDRDPQGRDLLYTYVPLFRHRDQMIWLEFMQVSDLGRQTQQAIVRGLLMIGAIAMVCIGIVVVAGVYLVGRPLDMLIEKTKRIGRGDFGERVELGGGDELGELAQALNDMCRQLAEQQETIQRESASKIAALSQLRHADRLKTVGRLAAGVAHELGTPLNVVSGRAGLIAGGKLSAEEVQQSATAIKAEADRITGVIRQLLDFARRNTPQRTRLDVREVIEQTAQLLKTVAEKSGVSMRILPEQQTNSRLVILADRGQLQQVLTNIMMNSIQAMPGGGEVAIELSRRKLQPPKEYVCVAICDQGGGISAEDREHIFEPFFTTKDIGEGTGLGLSIAYGIVQEHDGWIEVESEIGQGACFTIVIPAV